MKRIYYLSCLLLPAFLGAQQHLPESEYQSVEGQVIEWRHDIHQNPEPRHIVGRSRHIQK